MNDHEKKVLQDYIDEEITNFMEHVIASKKEEDKKQKKQLTWKKRKEWIKEGFYAGLGFLPMELILLALWFIFIG